VDDSMPANYRFHLQNQNTQNVHGYGTATFNNVTLEVTFRLYHQLTACVSGVQLKGPAEPNNAAAADPVLYQTDSCKSPVIGSGILQPTDAASLVFKRFLYLVVRSASGTADLTGWLNFDTNNQGQTQTTFQYTAQVTNNQVLPVAPVISQSTGGVLLMRRTQGPVQLYGVYIHNVPGVYRIAFQGPSTTSQYNNTHEYGVVCGNNTGEVPCATGNNLFGPITDFSKPLGRRQVYVNIRSANYPQGEARGQILTLAPVYVTQDSDIRGDASRSSLSLFVIVALAVGLRFANVLAL